MLVSGRKPYFFSYETTTGAVSKIPGKYNLHSCDTEEYLSSFLFQLAHRSCRLHQSLELFVWDTSGRHHLTLSYTLHSLKLDRLLCSALVPLVRCIPNFFSVLITSAQNSHISLGALSHVPLHTLSHSSHSLPYLHTLSPISTHTLSYLHTLSHICIRTSGLMGKGLKSHEDMAVSPLGTRIAFIGNYISHRYYERECDLFE